MKFFEKLKKSLGVGFCLGILLMNSNIYADHRCKNDCQNKVQERIRHNPYYHNLYKTLKPHIANLEILFINTVDQATYENLYHYALSIVSSIPSGQLLITDPAGVVWVDTTKGNLNTYNNAIAGYTPATYSSAININKNSDISILGAQQWECGLGVNTILDRCLRVPRHYVSIRLGKYLNNIGTARLSAPQLSSESSS